MSPSKLKRAAVCLCIAGVSIFASTPLIAAEVVYGISNSNGLVPADNQIYQIDPATGDLSNMVQVTLAGYTVGRVQQLPGTARNRGLAFIAACPAPATVYGRQLVDSNARGRSGWARTSDKIRL